MKEPVFEVFARKSRDEPLRHIGYVNAIDPTLAGVFAWKTYDEQNWFEMCVVPRDAIVPVNRPESPFGTPTPGTDELVRSTGTGSYGGSEVVGGSP
jgi:1,2-phenylacetyl-CoA epoxidase PaaB subunit